MRLDQVTLEMFIEEIADGQGPEAQGFGQFAPSQAMRLADQEQKFAHIARPQRRRIGRVAQQERPDEPALAHHGLAETRIGIGIRRAVARHFAAQRVVIRKIGEIIPVAREAGPAFVGDHLKAEARQFEIADDFAAQERADIGTVGIGPAFVQRPADRGAADPVVLFDDQNPEPRAREVARGGQPVMPRPGDDRVISVVPAHRPFSVSGKL